MTTIVAILEANLSDPDVLRRAVLDDPSLAVGDIHEALERYGWAVFDRGSPESPFLWSRGDGGQSFTTLAACRLVLEWLAKGWRYRD